MKKESTANADRLKSSAPLNADRILRFENVVKNQTPPESLQKLKSSNSFMIEESGPFKPEDLIQTFELSDGRHAYHIGSRNRVIRGLPMQAFHRLRRDEVRQNSPTLPLPPPRVPEWADIVYHPKISTGLLRPVMRRVNGKRVRPLYLFGPGDQRQAFLPQGYPWQCIGRIFVWTNPFGFPAWSGTGVLVSHNTVLTASHMVPWNADTAMMQFIPAYFNGVSTLGSNVYSYVDNAAAYYSEPDPADKPAWDFAVLRLIDPLGDSLGWFGARTYDDSWNDGRFWTLVGYPGAVAGGEQPSFQQAIAFHDDDEDGDAMELESDDGDQSPGDSGGPFFAWWEGDGWPSLVAVASSEETEWDFPWFGGPEENNVAAGGSPLVDLIQWARNNW
ncbi:serine protease [Paraburkholderia sp. BR10937]|uniref:serine protease n=1 Tax=Paraburkholderia sp. BR10937 TaxID=3236994 RepID=UPI0034D22473